MSRIKRFLLVVFPLVAATVVLAAPGEIRLATLAPANTSWHKALLDMGAAWNKDTQGRVTLTIYAGGTQGDESTVIRKMRPGIDTLQASFLTAAGLAELDEAFNAFVMPFFFENDAEEIAVEKQLTPVLEEAVKDRGVTLVKVDVDANKALAREYDVSGIPAVKAFKNGHVVAEFVGAKGRAAVDVFLDELTKPPVAESLEEGEVADALKAGDYERAFEVLLERAANPELRDDARSLMVELFGELGHEHPLTVQYRKRLATLIY